MAGYGVALMVHRHDEVAVVMAWLNYIAETRLVTLFDILLDLGVGLECGRRLVARR
jgi:hypothetical protein